MTSDSNKEYSVNWKNHMNHIRKVFDQLLDTNELTDVTLCCEGKKIKAHKMLLSACSAYFRDIFKDVPCQHPVIILYGVEYNVLSDILHFIYKGEVSVDTSKLDLFLKTAQLLQISGLTDAPTGNKPNENEQNPESVSTGQAMEETFGESLSQLPVTSEETNKGMKRSRPKETELPRPKLHKQESDTLFVSDVKCEPSELVHFGDPLEDPLLQSEQLNESKEFFRTAAAPVEDEFTIEVEEDLRFEELEEEEEEEDGNFEENNSPSQKPLTKSTIEDRLKIWTLFKDFCKQRQYTLNGTTTVEEISEILVDWGFNININKKKNRKDYIDKNKTNVRTVWCTTATILQQIFLNKYHLKFNPSREILFKKARKARYARSTELKFSSIPLDELYPATICCIWDENTPLGLEEKFCYIASLQLSWTAKMAAQCLVHHFKEELDQFGKFTGRIEYNGYFRKAVKSRTSRKSKWLMPNKENPSICPVRLLFRFLEKRKTTGSTLPDKLFLIPNPTWNKFEKSVWYKKFAAPEHQIAVWINDATEKIESAVKEMS